MSWQPIDFQRIVALDYALVEQLNQYLLEKEDDLAKKILESAPLEVDTYAPPKLEPTLFHHLKLSDAADVFVKRMRQAIKDDSLESNYNFQVEKENLNQAFWDYTEVLEGCVKEFFQQLEQLGINQWKSDILKVLNGLSDLLMQHMEDLIWAFKRIENELKEVRNSLISTLKKGSILKKIKASFHSVLDDTILSTLEKSQKFLRNSHKNFTKKFAEFSELDEKVLQIMKKFEGYHILSAFDDSFQARYKKIYYYIKMGQMSARPKSLSIGELMRTLTESESVESAIELFKEYVKALKVALFHQSRVLKKQSIRYLNEESGREKIEESMKGLHSEILSLGSTIARYREYLLSTDPNPYVRSRWGFSESIVAPEPEQTKQLLNLEFDLDNLENLYELLSLSISELFEEKEKLKREPLTLPEDIQSALHEMPQPLSSESIVKKRAEKVISYIKELDELGTPNAYVPKHVGEVLSKLLRADWKYHVVFEDSDFKDVFAIHMGIMGTLDDRKHLNRMNKFKHLINELESWVTLRETRKHEREIEFDINDLKGYLQDFLAHIQRIDKEEPLIEIKVKKSIVEASHELLMYRYLFGQFFHKLDQTSNEGKRLRLRLLFVDQYFESADQKLHELKALDFTEPQAEEEMPE